MSSADKIKTSLSVLTQEFKVYEEYKENYDFLLNLPIVQKLLIQNMNLELKLNELKNKNKVLNNEIYERYTKQTNINSVIEKPVLKKQHIQIKTENLDFNDYSLPPSYTLLEINNESLSEKFSIVKQPDTNTSGGVSNNIIITPLKTETNIFEPTTIKPTETNVKPTETNIVEPTETNIVEPTETNIVKQPDTNTSGGV
jgi:hypothetical protein